MYLVPIWLLDRRSSAEAVVSLDVGDGGFSTAALVGSAPDCQLVLSAPEIAPQQALLFAVSNHRYVEPLAPGVTFYGKPLTEGRRVDEDPFEIGPFSLAFAGSVSSGAAKLLPGPSTFHVTQQGPVETARGRAEREAREQKVLEREAHLRARAAERQAALEYAAKAPLQYDPERERTRRIEAGAPCPACRSQIVFECWCVCGQVIWAVSHLSGCTKSDGVTTSLASCPRCGRALGSG